MKIDTKIFGEIEIDDTKIITFENGIIGFPILQRFTLIHDGEKEGEEQVITWLQSIDEPSFALPVMNPLFVKEDYNPFINDELLKPLGNITNQNVCILVTVTVPKEVEKMAVNLRAPLVINIDEKKGSQLIIEDDYPVHLEVYGILKERKDREGR